MHNSLSHLTGPRDYEAGPYTVTFTAGQASATLPVPTEDDSIAELSEYFQVMITSTSTSMVIVGDPDTSFVTIEDDDGEIYIYCFVTVTVEPLKSGLLNTDSPLMWVYVCHWNLLIHNTLQYYIQPPK